MSPKDKEILDRIYDKHYGKGSKVKKENAKIEKVIKEKKATEDISPSPKEGIVMAAGTTRSELMLQCKERGVKNYRVLNKQEMTDILKNIGDQKYIDIVVDSAVRRWKSGWGTGKERKISEK